MIVREANRVPPREGPGPQRGHPGFRDNGDLASRPRKEGGRRQPRPARDEKTREAAAPVRGTGLFCGVGRATRGLEDVGIAIEMGVDIDPACGFLCSRLARETRPDVVTMESVPRLEGEGVFGGAIGDQPRLAAEEPCRSDPMHEISRLSAPSPRRVRASRPGGTWHDRDRGLRARCHARRPGSTHKGVYGRMFWDGPSPIITTRHHGLGNGRLGRPGQDCARSLREGAIQQGFPAGHRLVPQGRPISRKLIGRLVGNAVAIRLGETIGTSIARHVAGVGALSGRTCVRPGR